MRITFDKVMVGDTSEISIVIKGPDLEIQKMMRTLTSIMMGRIGFIMPGMGPPPRREENDGVPVA